MIPFNRLIKKEEAKDTQTYFASLSSSWSTKDDTRKFVQFLIQFSSIYHKIRIPFEKVIFNC